MPSRREFLEGAIGLPLSLFLLPRDIFGVEEPIEDAIDRGGPFSVALLGCDVPNSNGRIYPKEVVEAAIAEFNDENPLFGGLDYPIDDRGVLQMKDIAFTVEHLRLAENNDIHSGYWLWGDVRILGTPTGQVMKNILRDTGGLDRYAFRTVGVGDWKKDGDDSVIQDGYKLIAIGMMPIEEAAKI
jgi:hypothetical protein